jgi:CheY-like chemotaxis protein/DNA-binding HxlR family transcriptional regulator
LCSLILEREGFETIETHSGKECLERIRGEKPDLVLLDIMMPDMDGWEVCKTIKEDEALKSIPIIMLTIKFQEDAKLKSFQYAGCDGYISKPINKEKLIKAINWVLGEPHIDKKEVPSKCGIDCTICDQFIYEICKGCLTDRAESCTISECVVEKGVNTCFECVKIDYCKKRKAAVESCLVFNPAKETKNSFVYLVGEDEKEKGYAIFSRAVVEGSKGLVFTASAENLQLDIEGLNIHETENIEEISKEIHSFIKENPESVILVESIRENSVERPLSEVLKFVEDLHSLSLEKNVGFLVFLGELQREQRHQVFNYLASLQIEAIIRAISNPQRKGILELLETAGKSTFSEMLQALGYTNPSKLSFHLKVLKQVGIIDQDSFGIYYLTDTGRKLDELLYKMKDSVSSIFSITPDFEVVSAPNPVTEEKMEAYGRYIKAAEKDGHFKVVEAIKDLEESLSVFFGHEEANRIIITALDEYVSSEKMLFDEGLKKKISEIAFVFLSDAMPLEDAIDWADKLLLKYSLKPS